MRGRRKILQLVLKMRPLSLYPLMQKEGRKDREGDNRGEIEKKEELEKCMKRQEEEIKENQTRITFI